MQLIARWIARLSTRRTDTCRRGSVRSWLWFLALTGVLAGFPLEAPGQEPQVRATVGAYYFDGWSGKTNDIHLPRLLKTKYADRKPVWGWTADTVEIIEQQINYSADHDMAFWAFDWYTRRARIRRHRSTTPSGCT